MKNLIKNFDVKISAKLNPNSGYVPVCRLSIGECDGENSYIGMEGVDSLRIQIFDGDL